MSETLLDKLNQAVETKPEVKKEKDKPKTALDLIKDTNMLNQFTIALPKHIDGKRFQRIALTVLRTNEKLQQCNPYSVIGALMKAAQLGLEPDLLGQCYLIPFGNECQFIVGYQGLIELVIRTGKVSKIQAQIVYENDTFECTFGDGGRLFHQPNYDSDRGKVRGAYCYVALTGGISFYEFMSTSEIEKIRDKYSKNKGDNSIWKNSPEEMFKKTVIRRAFKMLPKSTDYRSVNDTLNADYQVVKGISQGEVEMETAEYEEVIS